MAGRRKKKAARRKSRSSSRRSTGRSSKRSGSSVGMNCECPSTAARRAFKKATSCSAKQRALTEINRLINEDTKLKPKAARMLRMDVVKKMKQTEAFCAAEESKDANRFNGLGRWR
jgi:hypothetical protein